MKYIEIGLLIYFGINLFMTGYYLNENLKWETKQYAIFFSVCCLFFGALLAVFVPLFYRILPIFSWIYSEIKFQYRFRFTDYWDRVILDPDYSDEYKTREEKLERIKRLNFNKQGKRHAEMIYNKYK